MSQSPLRAGLIVGGILLLGVLAAAARSKNSASTADLPPTVYICRESKEIFFSSLPLSEALHPETGRATLVAAVYCPECETWQPGPPIERRYGNSESLDCPKCRSLRSFTGDLPAEATEL